MSHINHNEQVFELSRETLAKLQITKLIKIN